MEPKIDTNQLRMLAWAIWGPRFRSLAHLGAVWASFWTMMSYFIIILDKKRLNFIHICSVFGIIIAILSGIYAIITILSKFLDPTLPIGYTSIFIAIIFFSGIQLIFLGLIGEYIGKILKNVNKEPQYSIEYIETNESEN